ncbi:Tumor necrosis factor receptor superfamily member 5 [Oryzias melastigma]|uniref:CD40 molecule, TNF receptor superfamily member 5 n=1 Tax=Oryzias melastigma TaxID=30732 RepID=A0A3B3CDI7_ORYME|nr:tumor necrosis factor receptor superfamily member 5 [Oryzias melastigma]KAF6737077.1 Tumor necrosis factor receptor superfamily member 5 [Oryzias melastigma]
MRVYKTLDSSKMACLASLILTVVFVVVDAQDLHCDPHTQFEKNGECCQMCPPGNRMHPDSGCNDPVCVPCIKGEYQDKYNTENTCRNQPYCDPNKNFKIPVNLETTVKYVCSCKDGFHCSTADCITCVAHTPCAVGFGVQTKGSHASDTVCEKCPDGTFSNESSTEDACRKWTECGAGYYAEKVGTDRSDNICAHSRVHVIAIVLGVLSLVAVVVGVILCRLYRGRSGSMSAKEPTCVECLGPQEYRPTPIIQEETKTPVENDDIGITENGNCVAQEDGNAIKLSRQESQMDTTTEHSTLFSSSSERLESY